MDPFGLSVESLRRRRGIKWHRYADDVLPAWVADMDFSVPEPVQRALEHVVAQQDYGYAVRGDQEALELAFADRMRERFGWELRPDQVRPIGDLVQAIVAALVAFTEPGDGVLVQTPIDPPFRSMTEGSGRRLVSNPLVDDGQRLVLDREGLRRAAADARLLLLCNPHNPSGRAFELDELEEIGRVAVDHDLIIISDEIHCDLVYPGHRHTPIASLGEEVAERTLTINSATKGFNIAGLRCGVMHFGSDALLERFDRAVPQRLLGSVSVIGVDATVAAWREGQPWLDQVMSRLQANRDRVAGWVAETAPAIRHRSPEATYLAWLDCGDLGLPAPSPQEFFLRRALVGLSKGGDFGPEGASCVRLNFATSPEILEQILSRMGAALRAAAPVS
jgi:cystathionine beta-lyase